MSLAPDASSRPAVTTAKILLQGRIPELTKLFPELTAAFNVDALLLTPDELGNDPMTAYSFNYIKKAMQDDRGYAWSWHCNLAMAFMDGGKVSHQKANEGAKMFMSFCFNVDVAQFSEYKHLEKQWYASDSLLADADADAAAAKAST